MALPSQDTLNRIFLELKSKNDDVRLKAAFDLHNHVSIAARGLLPKNEMLSYVLIEDQNSHQISFRTITQTSTLEYRNSSYRAAIQLTRLVGYWQ